jgi:hypothetical protein
VLAPPGAPSRRRNAPAWARRDRPQPARVATPGEGSVPAGHALPRDDTGRLPRCRRACARHVGHSCSYVAVDHPHCSKEPPGTARGLPASPPPTLSHTRANAWSERASELATGRPPAKRHTCTAARDGGHQRGDCDRHGNNDVTRHHRTRRDGARRTTTALSPRAYAAPSDAAESATRRHHATCTR